MKLHISPDNWKNILMSNKGMPNLGNVKKMLYKRNDLHNLIKNATTFCNKDTDIKTRLDYMLNEITEMNICKECNTLINDGGKKMFCSFSCRALNQAKDPSILKARAKTYSKTYSLKTEDEKDQIKINRKKTLQEKYGVGHNFKIDGFIEKRAITWEEKYGNTIAQQSKIVKQKTKETCEAKYGGPNPLSDPIVKSKWLASFYEKHGVYNSMHIDFIKRKVFASRLGIPIEDVEFIHEKLINKSDLTYAEYVIVVRMFTEQSLYNFGSCKFGGDWKKRRGKYTNHIDHCLSIRTGFLLGEDPRIIAHIENLELIPCNENLSKGAKDTLTINELKNKINKYEKTQIT